MANFGISELSVEYIIQGVKGHQHVPADPFRDDLTPASVLVLFLLKNSNWHLLFTKRTDTVQSHKRQVSFPGGAKEQGDLTDIDTSLREACEEIGLQPDNVTILGTMDKYATISNYLITPVIGMIPWPIKLRREKQEVDKIFTIPVKWLMKTSNHYEEWREFTSGRKEKVIYYRPYRGEVLWGISARITLQLLESLK